MANIVAWETYGDITKVSMTNNEPTITDTVLESVPMTKVFSLKKELPKAQTTAVISAEVKPMAIKLDAPPENNNAP